VEPKAGEIAAPAAGGLELLHLARYGDALMETQAD